jgi:hypothetical protein
VSVVITRAEVFSKVDVDHSIGEITRIGEEKYRFVGFDNQWEVDEEGERVRFDTFEEACAYADKVVAYIEADPAQFHGKVAFDQALAQHNAELARVSAEAEDHRRGEAEAHRRAEQAEYEARRLADEAEEREADIQRNLQAIADLQAQVAELKGG